MRRELTNHNAFAFEAVVSAAHLAGELFARGVRTSRVDDNPVERNAERPTELFRRERIRRPARSQKDVVGVFGEHQRSGVVEPCFAPRFEVHRTERSCHIGESTSLSQRLPEEDQSVSRRGPLHRTRRQAQRAECVGFLGPVADRPQERGYPPLSGALPTLPEADSRPPRDATASLPPGKPTRDAAW